MSGSGSTSRTSIDRTDFGIKFTQRMPGGGLALANEVNLEFKLVNE